MDRYTQIEARSEYTALIATDKQNWENDDDNEGD